ncbi:MAG: hypothetical protein H5U03_05990, partial [Clostridia bacterium]|nr:hypothetical protein [Clostridia bacterium]
MRKLHLVVGILVLSYSACLGAPSKNELYPHLEGSLIDLWQSAITEPSAVPLMAGELGISLKADMVEVVVRPVDYNPDMIDFTRLKSLGASVEMVSQDLVLALVPVERLVDVAETVPGVAFVRRPYKPHALTVSEGVSLTGADAFHSAGYYGQGAKVAVIDPGFQGLTAALSAGELANVVYTHDYTGTGLETGTEHGTAVAEIFYDMAPQASFYLFKIGNEVHLQNAVTYCVNNGIHIVNHSVSWFNTNFYDGTGVIAETAAYARDQGILWVNAAGNFA